MAWKVSGLHLIDRSSHLGTDDDEDVLDFNDPAREMHHNRCVSERLVHRAAETSTCAFGLYNNNVPRRILTVCSGNQNKIKCGERVHPLDPPLAFLPPSRYALGVRTHSDLGDFYLRVCSSTAGPDLRTEPLG
jgi:hypothetical protein